MERKTPGINLIGRLMAIDCVTAGFDCGCIRPAPCARKISSAPNMRARITQWRLDMEFRRANQSEASAGALADRWENMLWKNSFTLWRAHNWKAFLQRRFQEVNNVDINNKSFSTAGGLQSGSGSIIKEVEVSERYSFTGSSKSNRQRKWETLLSWQITGKGKFVSCLNNTGANSTTSE